jgi:hypothetical protein
MFGSSKMRPGGYSGLGRAQRQVKGKLASALYESAGERRPVAGGRLQRLTDAHVFLYHASH